ncbi:MAG: hypothetical protein AAB317_02550 [Nitrospirota bacterium]
MQKDWAKHLFVKWQKQISLVFTIGCLLGTAITLAVGYSLFHERPTLFGVFVFYVVTLTLVVIYFGRKIIAMIGES